MDPGANTSRPTPGIAVVQRVDSPGADALAVAELTELGACEVSALASGEVLRVLEARHKARAARWRQVALEAAERSGRTWLPRTGSTYSPEGLQRRFDWGGTGLVLDETATTSISTVELAEGELILVVGDPGVTGWVDRVCLDEHAPNPRAAAIAAMTVLAERLGFR